MDKNKTYSSLLIVRHPTHCDVYIKGIQIGIWKDGSFQRSKETSFIGEPREFAKIDSEMISNSMDILHAITDNLTTANLQLSLQHE